MWFNSYEHLHELLTDWHIDYTSKNALQMEHSFLIFKILHESNFTLRVCMGIEIAKP